ncbi:hypothetical protein GQ44DRAFT_13549 [Phaeosphaeriaceae sp. PMI808]|nr:hypothetical protein GQ44DRAFT_13549 [Phaeosphaeriaceae sp. PMI808]
MLSTSSMTQLPTMDYGSMDRTLSAPSMARSTSTAAQYTDAMQRSTSSIPTWTSVSQEPASDYALYSNTPMRRQQALPSITEGATYCTDGMTEWNVNDYLDTLVESSPASLTPSLAIPPQQLHVQLTPNLQWNPSSDGSTSPSTPSTALMTPVTQSSNAMSRQSSYNSHFLEVSPMFRVHSDSSCMSILPEDGDISFPLCVDSKAISNCVDSSLFSTFTASVSENFFSPTQSISTSAQTLVYSDNDMPYLAEDMQRSASTTSSESNASDASAPYSICSRQSRRDREINAQAAARKIAPKAVENNDETESAPSNAQMAEITSEDGSSKTVGVISKTPYVRPKHAKIMCNQCNERAEGFRGTHELDRHVARAHAPKRKGFICVDFSNDKKFLANCKHCRNKKVYGAYYNAAAHLRRAHFHPRKRGRKGKNDEKRGGIGGGDHPPMDLLKTHWIKEVEVDNNPSSPYSVSDDAAEAADNSYDAPFDMDVSASYPSQQPMHSSTSNHVHIDQGQYMDYGLNMSASEPIISFQFDAYMAQ